MIFYSLIHSCAHHLIFDFEIVHWVAQIWISNETWPERWAACQRNTLLESTLAQRSAQHTSITCDPAQRRSVLKENKPLLHFFSIQNPVSVNMRICIKSALKWSNSLAGLWQKKQNRTWPYLYHFLQTLFLQNEAKSVKLIIAELYLLSKNEPVCQNLASFVKNHRSAKKHYIGPLLSWKLNIFFLSPTCHFSVGTCGQCCLKWI